ncbi:hypothetical protein [Paraglaciecola hydrolytica]|uniref:Uncharacterized protein n=1 Tax=Paraglaciecola hydrolytica TaxID=1799789 RepID=A0A135ZZ92_9ALTE|nr:hypothetical protein [Paraglaciecola hydrolytica]KXI28200.1 hypothetical protein AX660_17635 [Paraglaciecola hydrolytica]
MKYIFASTISLFLILIVVWGFNKYTSRVTPDFKQKTMSEHQLTTSLPLNELATFEPIESNNLMPASSRAETENSLKDKELLSSNESQFSKFQKETIEFTESPVFDSILKLDSAFVNEQNVVNKRPLEIIFRSPNLDSIIEKMNSMAGNQESEERQQKLYSQLVTQLGNDFHSEKFSCKGKVCLLAFTYDNSVNSDVLSKLRDFDTNYVFSSNKLLDNNDVIYRGVFIATEDASSMTISP